jgi:hypothetical protein
VQHLCNLIDHISNQENSLLSIRLTTHTSYISKKNCDNLAISIFEIKITWSRISVDCSAPWWKISIISFRNLTPLFWTWGRGWQGHTGRRAQILGWVKKSENMISAKSDCTPMGQKCGLCDSVLVNIGFRFRVTWGDRYHTRFCMGHNTMPKKWDKIEQFKKTHIPFEFWFFVPMNI